MPDAEDEVTAPGSEPQHYPLGQRLFRLARRHAAILAVSVAALLALLAAGGTIGVLRLLAERDRARREAEASRRVSDFITSMFRVPDPSEARGNTVTAREILDRAAREIEISLAMDPLVQATVMHSIGNVYFDL